MTPNRCVERVQSVRYDASDAPSINFGLAMKTLVRTSSATIQASPTMHTLRVPVASDARALAAQVVHQYQAAIDQQRAA